MLGLTPQQFFDLTPYEINIKIESYNEAHRAHDADIYELAALITIGFNQPKSFPKSLQKFRPDPRVKAMESAKLHQQAGVIGMRVPTGKDAVVRKKEE